MSMKNDVVENILSSKDNTFKGIDVFKEVDPYYDEGNLLIDDLEPIKIKDFNASINTYLRSIARDNTQLLFNKIWQLPIEKTDNVVLVKLPAGKTLLPREKPIPKPKPPTKWEKYAKDKGIQKKKRTRMIWDEEAKDWKPRHGYKRANDNTKDWCIEVPDNVDPMEDQFAKRDNEKKERVAKNELQRLRNIARNVKGGKGIIMSTQFKPDNKKDKERVSKEMIVAKQSTASLGKFQQKLPKEKPEKKTGKKRKFESVCGDIEKEKERQLEIWGKVNKPAILDVTKGVNKYIASEEKQESMSRKTKKGSGGKVKNKRYRKGKQATMDRKKSKTLGKKR